MSAFNQIMIPYSSFGVILISLNDTSSFIAECPLNQLLTKDINDGKTPFVWVSLFSCAQTLWLINAQVAHASEYGKPNMLYETGELFELGIQLSYLLLLLGFLGVGTFFVIRQVLVRRELDLSAKELQAIPPFTLDGNPCLNI